MVELRAGMKISLIFDRTTVGAWRADPSRSELESHRGGRRCERGVWRTDPSLSPTEGVDGAKETRDGRRGETVRERRGAAAGRGGAMHERPVRGMGGVVSVCYVRERTEGEGAVSFGKWFTENFSVNRFPNFCEGFYGQTENIFC